MTQVTLRDAWEANADDWVAWARTQGHDGFWQGTWPELAALLPHPLEGPVIEVGCGEGRAGRKLLELGAAVVGVEQSAALAYAARNGPQRLTVVQADGAHLPFGNSTSPTVVACMSLLDMDDLANTVLEIARILRPGGHLCVALVHPMASAQDPETMHTEEVRVTLPYLAERRYEDAMERNGLRMTFVSMHRPLGAYVSACAEAGLLMEAMREFGTKPVPWLLTARFVKLTAATG